MKITSLQNSSIKNVIKLQQKSRERKKQGLFVVEGLQENRLAIDNKYVAVEYYINQTLYNNDLKIGEEKVNVVSDEVYNHMAYRGSTEGIVGVYKTKNLGLSDIGNKDSYFLVVLEGVEKPGNLGAILRSVDATKADALIVIDAKVDFFNPNVIRSSVGTLFSNFLVSCSFDEFTTFSQNNKIEVYPTFLNGKTQNLYTKQFTTSSALVFGTESTGLQARWNNDKFNPIKIPMLGQVDSLNVSNAVAVCLYEVVRQRKFN